MFSNVIVNCARTPIRVQVDEGIRLPRLANLSFSDFTIRSGGPCIVQGSPETIVENVRFANMQIETTGEDAIICRYCLGVQITNIELSNRANDDDENCRENGQ